MAHLQPAKPLKDETHQNHEWPFFFHRLLFQQEESPAILDPHPHHQCLPLLGHFARKIKGKGSMKPNLVNPLFLVENLFSKSSGPNFGG